VPVVGDDVQQLDPRAREAAAADVLGQVFDDGVAPREPGGLAERNDGSVALGHDPFGVRSEKAGDRVSLARAERLVGSQQEPCCLPGWA
jgi:hypothetical protein